AGANFNVSAPVNATTAPIAGAGFSGAGGNVSLFSIAGTLNLDARIQVSSNDPVAAAAQRSASGGSILINSGGTSGTGISLTSNANLLSLLNPAAPGPGGTITLSTDSSDIISNGATIQADRGTIVISQSNPAPIGTNQITLNGGAITSETLLASSRGDLSIGTTATVNVSSVTISWLASRNLSWGG